MRKDAERLLKYIIDESKVCNNAQVNIDINEIKNIPNVEFAKYRLLDELKLEGVISGYEENILGDLKVYLTSDGMEYFEDLAKNSIPSEIILNVPGGQVNIAHDNARIDAVLQAVERNFGTDNEEFRKDDLLINFCDEDCFTYYMNMHKNSLIINSIDEINRKLSLCVKFDTVSQNDYSDKFAGYCIKDIPSNWCWIIDNGYILHIDYETDNDIDMWVEIKAPQNELYKKKFLLNGKNTLSIDLGKYVKRKNGWINISELCLVFRPYYDRMVESNIKITDIVLDKPA